MKENTKKKTSISTKLLTIIVPVVSILVVALILISFNVSKKMIQDSSKELLRSSVSSQSAKINSWLDQNLSTLSAAKQAIEATDMDDATLQRMLNGFYNYNSNFPEGIYIATSDGKTMKASESSKDFTGHLSNYYFFNILNSCLPPNRFCIILTQKQSKYLPLKIPKC